MTSDERPRAQCYACGKVVMLRKNGTLWHHRGYERDYPGSPFTKLCTGAGKRQEDS